MIINGTIRKLISYQYENRIQSIREVIIDLVKNREKSTFREISLLRLIILSKMLLQIPRTSSDTFYELLVEG